MGRADIGVRLWGAGRFVVESGGAPVCFGAKVSPWSESAWRVVGFDDGGVRVQPIGGGTV
ncbi:hypothetical protein D5S18_30825 [Nocardia panacis]|uniref:Uncharacterized protein n=1 Tax=Nocardia panacis TaxID=2340916 RepID=A0A3A4JXS1_9NOCA|nr:hypothetical protein D5S18_30825 [Nocardia panacis]